MTLKAVNARLESMCPSGNSSWGKKMKSSPNCLILMGHTQTDFGEFYAFRNGSLTAFQYLVLSFPYSNAGFAQVLPGENSECLLEGLKWIFQHLGGVPHKIRFDNLSAAVTLRKKNRKINESFDRFCLHYGFEAEFCNVACANEKGNVESKVVPAYAGMVCAYPKY